MRDIGFWFGLSSVAEGADVVVLGCPDDGAASGRRGAREAPGAIRHWSQSAEAVSEDGEPFGRLRVHDAGDATGGFEAIAAAAHAALQACPGALLLGLGGDHAVTQPLLDAVASEHPDLALLLLDAHPDLFDEYEGDRASHACTVRRAWDTSGVAPESTAIVGLRSYAVAELEALRSAGCVVTARDWAAQTTAQVADRVVECLGDRPVYVSLDIDVLDPADAPGTGYPVAAGPSSRDLLDLLAALWPRLRVVAADLVEVAPGLDATGITAATAAHVLLQLLGHEARRRS